MTTDPGYRYAAEHTFDVTGLKPQLAVPIAWITSRTSPPISARPINQAFLGTCTGGRVEDLAVAARILKGRHVHPRTRFVVVPASKGSFWRRWQGYIQTLVEAGATFVTPRLRCLPGDAPGDIGRRRDLHHGVEP